MIRYSKHPSTLDTLFRELELKSYIENSSEYLDVLVAIDHYDKYGPDIDAELDAAYKEGYNDALQENNYLNH